MKIRFVVFTLFLSLVFPVLFSCTSIEPSSTPSLIESSIEPHIESTIPTSSDTSSSIDESSSLPSVPEDIGALLLKNLSEVIQVMPEFKQRYYFSDDEDYDYIYLSDNCRVILTVAGDFTGDGVDDFAVGLEITEEEVLEFGVPKGEFGPRQLYVLIGDADESFTIIGTTSLMEFWMGGVFGDPLVSVTIEDGSLCISYYGGSSDRWGNDMRYIYDDGQVVLAYERNYLHSTHTLTGEETIYDYISCTVKRYEVDLYEDVRTLVSSEVFTTVRHVLGSVDSCSE